ncbi:MAG: NAD-dependent epimerase/dehydratase family protein [Thermodesulfobacteriota bacterium]
MRVLILGGDGYLGWPTAMHLSAQGCEVGVVDSYLRRRLAREEDVEPLYEVPNLQARIRRWSGYSGRTLWAAVGDLLDWEFVARVFREFQPEAIVHYAEQPSAPYSMLRRQAADLTLHNNLGVTANVIHAIREFCPQVHLIKLGTMGEYGTPDIDIEEGWLQIHHQGRSDRFLFPRQAGSLYHSTKIMDTDLLWFYVRIWGLRVTDLMQGPVYGVFTDENEGDEALLPFFSYDELFGTVLNRFVVQAVAGVPLTVYGKGGQTRGYLNIRDTLNCVRLSLENPPGAGELRIFNQFTETFTVNDLAQRVQRVGQAMGLPVTVQHLPNPRVEKEEHYYNPRHTGLLELGLQPHFLTDAVLQQLLAFVVCHQDRIDHHKIFRGTTWA